MKVDDCNHTLKELGLPYKYTQIIEIFSNGECRHCWNHETVAFLVPVTVNGLKLHLVNTIDFTIRVPAYGVELKIVLTVRGDLFTSYSWDIRQYMQSQAWNTAN